MTQALNALGLRQTVIEVGLHHNVGVGGNRLNGVQRQKLGLARALLKRPDLLIVADALAVMDPAGQARVMERVLDIRRGRGVVWIVQRSSACERFDQVLVMRDGRLIEQGRFAELNKPGSALSDIMAAE